MRAPLNRPSPRLGAWASLLAGAAIAGLAWPAAAQDAPPDASPAADAPRDPAPRDPAPEAELGVTAEVRRPMARTGGDDPTASVTAVSARDRPRGVDTVEDAIREVPGARPLASGAYGSPSSLSLRGSDGDQVEVLFGDLPITTADGGSFDLSSVPLWSLERIEVYRGGAPTWLGAGAIGGVLRLVPRRGSEHNVRGALGAGSFGLAHGRASASVADDDVDWVASAGVTTSEGDFPILDDANTAFDPADDVERPRGNAWLREASGVAHLGVALGGGRLSIFGFGLARQGGVPGPASQETRTTHRAESHLLGAVGWERTEGGRPAGDADWRVSAGVSGGYRRRRVTDPFAEVGLTPRATDDEALRLLARLAASGRPLSWLELTAVGRYGHEALWPEDRLVHAERTPDASARDAGTLALESRFFGELLGARFDLRPSARLEVAEARLHELRADRSGDASDALTVAPTFRIAAAIEPTPGVTIAASAASATRLPTALELFGDRAFLLGDTRLRPERAETFDLGVVARGREGPVRGQGEVRGFVTLGSDLIRYRRNNQFQSVPENVASAVIAGAELGARGEITRHFALSGALTLMETWTTHLGRERRLPLRPAVSGYVRPEGRLFALGPFDRLSLFVELLAVSQSSWDPANTSLIPARARFGAGLGAWVLGGRLRADVWVRDVFDARGADLLGFPLPGRAFGATVTIAAR